MNITNVQELVENLTKPTAKLIHDIKKLKGDIIILGVGGKMGPSLAKLAMNAIKAGRIQKKVIGVSRFSNPEIRTQLEDYGIKTYAGDLLDEDFLKELPLCENLIYMAGIKFGTSGKEHVTWAMNTYLPGRVAEKYLDSRIVVFSSGNIYPFTKIESKGATEDTKPNPVGEYAQSCLGRERIFEHFSIKHKTPSLIFRLNYAADLRYGVLLEVAKSVYNNNPINLTTAYVNVIWQGDANSRAIRSLLLCSSPPKVLNITGPETISIEWLANKFGKLMHKTVRFIGKPEQTALLNNASHSFELFGLPSVKLNQMIEWTAHWVMSGGFELDKPTHFQERKGEF